MMGRQGFFFSNLGIISATGLVVLLKARTHRTHRMHRTRARTLAHTRTRMHYAGKCSIEGRPFPAQRRMPRGAALLEPSLWGALPPAVFPDGKNSNAGLQS